jgi:hypothetical protein
MLFVQVNSSYLVLFGSLLGITSPLNESVFVREFLLLADFLSFFLGISPEFLNSFRSVGESRFDMLMIWRKVVLEYSLDWTLSSGFNCSEAQTGFHFLRKEGTLLIGSNPADFPLIFLETFHLLFSHMFEFIFLFHLVEHGPNTWGVLSSFLLSHLYFFNHRTVANRWVILNWIVDILQICLLLQNLDVTNYSPGGVEDRNIWSSLLHLVWLSRLLLFPPFLSLTFLVLGCLILDLIR